MSTERGACDMGWGTHTTMPTPVELAVLGHVLAQQPPVNEALGQAASDQRADVLIEKGSEDERGRMVRVGVFYAGWGWKKKGGGR